jgi:GGDEF domain-containing protein
MGLAFLLIRRHLAGHAATETALQTLVSYDELAGLANRRQVNYRLTDEVARTALWPFSGGYYAEYRSYQDNQ